MLDLDHRHMTPPSLALVDQRPTPAGDSVALWHLRVAQPNIAHIPPAVVHSFEHFLIYLMAEEQGPVIAAAPMGCQTGYYILAVNLGDFDGMAAILAEALLRITKATAVPCATTKECGWAENHSLSGAKDLAAWLLLHRDTWARVTTDASDD